MNESKVFTKAELKVLNDRVNGCLKDKTGIFYSRIKPKILELFEWFKKRKELEEVIKPIKRRGK